MDGSLAILVYIVDVLANRVSKSCIFRTCCRSFVEICISSTNRRFISPITRLRSLCLKSITSSHNISVAVVEYKQMFLGVLLKLRHTDWVNGGDHFFKNLFFDIVKLCPTLFLFKCSWGWLGVCQINKFNLFRAHANYKNVFVATSNKLYQIETSLPSRALFIYTFWLGLCSSIKWSKS